MLLRKKAQIIKIGGSMRALMLMVLAFTAVVFLSSCAPGSGVSQSKYGPDDPSNKIVIEEDLSKRDMIDGYRIKVASVDTEPEALMIEKKIAEAVQEPVYVEFIVDKYMIYAGDCQNKEEANILKDRLTAAGFDKIYSVPKKVFRKVIPVVTEKATGTAGSQDITRSEGIPSSFGRVIGYRVQIFAARDKSNAERVKAAASKDIKERIYLVLADDNLYKVQIGDFLSKIDAEKARDRIITMPNYKDAFIQNTYIYFDNSAAGGSHFIQVGSFSTKQSAEDFIKTSLNSLGYNNTEIFFDNNLYKVLVGSYGSNNEASSVRDRLRSDGFEGAWIIQK
jgi:cell division protein FtsN